MDKSASLLITSSHLSLGHVYSRADLKTKFEISDATINTGVFKPKNHQSIWLFVTKKKTPDRTQYSDNLDGDTLYWQGQTSGRTDESIRGHEAKGIELLLFYRQEKYEFSHAGFKYEGSFRYLHDVGNQPASFVLKRKNADGLEIAQQKAEADQVFNPTDIEDARRKTFGAIVRRRGQQAFRQALLKAYDDRCTITGCDVKEVLEAAHIYPYMGAETNHVTNGLLLRADLHTLFDLGLISINPDSLCVEIHQSLQQGPYSSLSGIEIRLPNLDSQRPSTAALKWHREQSKVVDNDAANKLV